MRVALGFELLDTETGDHIGNLMHIEVAFSLAALLIKLLWAFPATTAAIGVISCTPSSTKPAFRFDYAADIQLMEDVPLYEMTPRIYVANVYVTPIPLLLV